MTANKKGVLMKRRLFGKEEKHLCRTCPLYYESQDYWGEMDCGCIRFYRDKPVHKICILPIPLLKLYKKLYEFKEEIRWNYIEGPRLAKEEAEIRPFEDAVDDWHKMYKKYAEHPEELSTYDINEAFHERFGSINGLTMTELNTFTEKIRADIAEQDRLHNQ